VTAEPPLGERLIGRIPVRNLWLLMLYASELVRFRGEFNALVDADNLDLPDLVGRLLANAVELRLKRDFTRGYRHRAMILTRVRGRIDILRTESHLLLSKGEVACVFQDLTIDTPRNRFVRAALELMTRLVRDQDLVQRCRALTSTLARLGVGGTRPSRSDLVLDTIGRNDAADRLMVALAQLAFDLGLPTEDAGQSSLVSPEREENWVRRLFEKAVLGFARVELEPIGWVVRGGLPLYWQVSSSSEALPSILPRMVTDIILDPPDGGRRILVDTTFTAILGSRRFGGTSLKSEYLYQMYAYVRSQVGLGPLSDEVAGLFLHPSINTTLREHVVIQGHPITFATVNLQGSAAAIRGELREILR
jgi:5-methylcytosine-specific restriction enzyme subunit McrC